MAMAGRILSTQNVTMLPEITATTLSFSGGFGTCLGTLLGTLQLHNPQPTLEARLNGVIVSQPTRTYLTDTLTIAPSTATSTRMDAQRIAGLLFQGMVLQLSVLSPVRVGSLHEAF